MEQHPLRNDSMQRDSLGRRPYQRKSRPKTSDYGFNMALSENMRKILNKKGLKQRHVAKQMGICPSALNRYIKENRCPSLWHCYKFCEACGVSIDMLVEGISADNDK